MSNKLFDECIKAIGKKNFVFNRADSEIIFHAMITLFPLSLFRVDWEKVNNKIEINWDDFNLNVIQDFLHINDDSIFLIFDNAELPVVKTNLLKVFNVLDDVRAVSTYVWVFSPKKRYVIELHSEIFVGYGIDISTVLEIALEQFIEIRLPPTDVVSKTVLHEIEEIGSNISSITKKLLKHENIAARDMILLDTKHLYSSAWLCSDGKKYPLMNEPVLLQYAKMIEDLKKQCKDMIAYNKSIELLQDS